MADSIMTSVPVIREDYSDWGKKYVQWMLDSKITMGSLCRVLKASNMIYTALKYPERSLVTKDRMEAFRIYVETGRDLSSFLDDRKKEEAKKETLLTRLIKRRMSELGYNCSSLGKALNLRPEMISRLINGLYLNGKNIKRLLAFLDIKNIPRSLTDKGVLFTPSTRYRIDQIREWKERYHFSPVDLSLLAYGHKGFSAPIRDLLGFKRNSPVTLKKLEELTRINGTAIGSLKEQLSLNFSTKAGKNIRTFLKWKRENRLSNAQIASFLETGNTPETIRLLDELSLERFWPKLKWFMKYSFLAKENNPNLTEEDLTDHDCVVALIRNKKNKFLVMNHVKLKRWMPPLGKVKLGESLQEGLKRELREELGIKVTDGYQLLAKEDYVLHRNGKEVTITFNVFEILAYEGRIQNLEPQKCKSLRYEPYEWIRAYRYTSHAMYTVANALMMIP